MRNRLLFAIPLAGILGGLALLHAYWALGGRWGSAYTVPTVNARRPLPVLFDIGVWGLGLVFALRAVGNLRTFGFFKIVKGTPFADWDTWFYSPLCVLIALLVVGLARL